MAGNGVMKYDFIQLSFYSTYWVHVHVLDTEDVEMSESLTSWSSQSSGENQYQAARSRCAECCEMNVRML